MALEWLAAKPSNPYVTALVLAGGSAVCFFFGFRNLARSRKIRDTAVSKAASAPQGYVELEGFAWPDGSATSNLTERPVVYYQIAIEEYKKSGDKKKWVRVWSTAGPTRFMVCDDTGACLVSANESHVDAESRNFGWGQLSPAQRQLVIGRVGGEGVISGFPPSSGFIGGLFSNDFRVVESYIEVGAAIFAAGSFKSLVAGPRVVGDAALERFAGRLSAFRKDRRKFQSILDKNKDGQVSEQEYRDGFAQAARLAFASPDGFASPEAETAYSVHGELKAEKGSRCEISIRGQAALMRRLTAYGAGLLLLGSLLIWALVMMVQNGLLVRR